MTQELSASSLAFANRAQDGTALGTRGWLIAIALFAITLGLYARTSGFDFINYDDQAYVHTNANILGGFTLNNFHRAMTATINGNWHPLTTLTWLVLASLFGPNPGTFHLTNALLHAINASLFFIFLQKATGRSWLAFFAAALWALHPQRVESVAWISELKDTLCGTMWLACMLAYLHYCRHRSIASYLLVALFLALAIVSKPIAVTLPLVLLLLDYWPINSTAAAPASSATTSATGSAASSNTSWIMRWIEKLPLIAISGAGILIALRIRIAFHLAASSQIYPLNLRLKNLFVSYLAYLRDTFFPIHLSLFYPHPGMVSGASISAISAISAAAVLLLISTAVCIFSRGRRYLFTGWFWFLGTLVPNSGLVQSGDQARADRFSYFPAMGLAILVVWLVNDLLTPRPRLRPPLRPWLRSRLMPVGVAAGIAVAFLLAFLSASYISDWRNTSTLTDHMLRVDPHNYVAMELKAQLLTQAGDHARAIELSERALRIAPNDQIGRIDYAASLSATGRNSEAAAQLFQVLNNDPWDAQAWDALGVVRDVQANEFAAQGKPDLEADYRRRAVTNFQNARRTDPDLYAADEHLATELAAQNKLDDAITVWNQLLTKKPDYAQAQGDLAEALRRKGDFVGATQHFQLAIANGSKNPGWESTLAYLVATNPLMTAIDVQPMIAIAKDACDQTSNKNAGALDAYAACLARVGRFDDAVATAQQGIAVAAAAHQASLAKEIQGHLELYQQNKPYVVGSDKTPEKAPDKAPEKPSN
jgi:tetratricopeptide (TPR) repeat protein